jgi:hypothetical protein
MSSTHDWLERNHEDLYDQATQTKTYILLPENRDRMGFSPGTAQGIWLDGEFVPHYTTFETAFTNWKDPSSRTKTITRDLEDAEDLFKPTYRKLYTGFLKESPLVTHHDLEAMGLPVRPGGHTPSPIPTSSPDSDANTGTPRRIILSIFENNGTHKRAKPDGVHGAETRWAIFDNAQGLVTLDALIHSSFCTRSPLTLDFTEEQRGKFLYYALRWENTRGEKGPFSLVQSVIIP